MTSGRGALTALHLFLVWAMTATAVPALGFGLVAAAWGGGAGATVPVLALGAPLMVGLLALVGLPVKDVVPLCGSVPRRLGWAVLVFVLGTLGVLSGLAAYGGDVDLGSAGTRIVLTGVPYTVAAAFFVPGRWVRSGALVVLAAGVVYGGFVGPAQSRQRQHEAEVARYREKPELLYLGAAPPGMHVSRAELGPATFVVDYRPVREGYESGYAGLVVRSSDTPEPRCPEPVDKSVTCTVDAHGEVVMVREFPDGTREVTLVRRHGKAEVSVASQSVDESGLRRLLDTLHPLSDTELGELMREKKIDHRL
ncbi:hypothetical protein OIC43_11675 [Streptomyces sp. NBC_00825]|uniref:hypothetical protein n=1 Tax=unclassified Streptomyces TaxID=2593676 RepID=UPI00224DCD4B|nr:MULTISPECIES: hypothetical protein [unclassified Streptomyces]WTB57463.1 hypothetical protein OG832_32020 [Streptomyces sp. NBC_00826]WTH89655.1 hypothetical protein OIC43_11675 [Streptomyces sp. NBC_00825]WTH98382.1 hypothetical protein OHA23_11660 [Streptomyces sp. NBC_00822]MCX4863749.1 hypothetical protein [Streptomyces sp. NBC_00906]MCX4894987.1 hypothetical protein [Streptomyces sp. NBC_00892]